MLFVPPTMMSPEMRGRGARVHSQRGETAPGSIREGGKSPRVQSQSPRGPITEPQGSITEPRGSITEPPGSITGRGTQTQYPFHVRGFLWKEKLFYLLYIFRFVPGGVGILQMLVQKRDQSP